MSLSHTASSYDPGAQLAYPCDGPNERAYGLTKREYAAIEIMAGMASDSSWDNTLISERAEHAVKCADALLAALDIRTDEEKLNV